MRMHMQMYYIIQVISIVFIGLEQMNMEVYLNSKIFAVEHTLAQIDMHKHVSFCRKIRVYRFKLCLCLLSLILERCS